ncbi:UDP-N-acetylmuramate dehydrogenase [Lacimicrobium sp. SS2-24]|uniref:UDP-N-acetylmuramate dehydrogenase n=1 Tax=Lacimicrobium sp. SS2-24 TaxID=2005569 RepID=UPI001FED9A6B|nr:UDP-N-acetylmuramate dehydrogenase [Lacimicrobium sp. SS2-24]
MINLASYHTFGFQSSAQSLVEIESLKSVPELDDGPQYVLGDGSNTVFLEDFEGTILKVSIKGVSVSETDTHYVVSVGAGENWHRLVVWLLEQGIYGAENLALIPGTVGASPIQNIGAYGRELADFCHSVEAVHLDTREVHLYQAQDCHFSYRDSIFKHAGMHRWMITRVQLRFPKQWQGVTDYGELKSLGSNPSAREIFDTVVKIRKQKLPDPQVVGNAGSFFKNPYLSVSEYAVLKTRWPTIPAFVVNDTQVKVPAAWFIDTLGFKGKTVGGIICHQQQPLVLANFHAGEPQDLLQLAREIKQRVSEEFGVNLENEVRLIGARGAVEL